MWLLHSWDGDVHLRPAEEQTSAHHGGRHAGSGWFVVLSVTSIWVFPVVSVCGRRV